ncbi:secreted RxLR effector protein 161-like [Telopea speciosissima]|uniref:secreted RxLR effector protein 161-like n=1 Tax=Telopea speciosissima TaxID=54955 RepID=UPI001CC67F89|nr:secreted RxLR effector protein 161-like [Telopea speciosissima]
MDPHQKLGSIEGKDFSDVHRYRRLVGKLIYLTVTRPDISFVVGVISQFMQCPKKIHWDVACHILRYLKSATSKGLIYRPNQNANLVGFSDADWVGADGDRSSTTGFSTFVGGNLVTWKSKKQTTVARSSAEAKYRAMAHTTAELMWPKQMFCEKQAAIYIANNPVFHERTKHIEVDCHFVRDAVMKKLIATPFVSTTNQLGDMFTKALFGPVFVEVVPS